MDFSIKLHTLNEEWFIVFIEGSQVLIPKYIVIFSLKIDFVLANSTFAKVPLLGVSGIQRVNESAISCI